MVSSALQEEFLAIASGGVRFEEPMRFHTSFHIGGPAGIWAQPRDSDGLRRLLLLARQADLKVTVVGGGANLLVRDEGIPGLVIRLASRGFQDCRRQNGSLSVGAGLPLDWLIRRAQEAGLSGVEFLAGVPGRVGGAVRMNAGTHDDEGRMHSMNEILHSVTVMDLAGETAEIPAAEIPFRYRSAELGDRIVLGATLSLRPDDPQEIAGRVRRLWDFKKRTQDWSSPSAGCIFKNPEPGECPQGVVPAAGWLIDQVGLKGCRVGGAMVSQVHANFIMNVGDATAQDVWSLIEKIRHQVSERFGVKLGLEVRTLP